MDQGSDRSRLADYADPSGSTPAGIGFAYRRLGPDSGVPVVMLNHRGANLDNFDPCLVEGLAADRLVYALDYRGVGASGGKTPLTAAAAAADVIAMIRALGLSKVGLVGFSRAAWWFSRSCLMMPALVRRAGLAGAGPAGGIGIDKVWSVSWPLI